MYSLQPSAVILMDISIVKMQLNINSIFAIIIALSLVSSVSRGLSVIIMTVLQPMIIKMKASKPHHWTRLMALRRMELRVVQPHGFFPVLPGSSGAVSPYSMPSENQESFFREVVCLSTYPKKRSED